MIGIATATSKAIPKFEEVKRLYDKHYGVADYLSKSQKAISEGKNRIDWNDYSVYFVIGGSVLLLFILLLVLLVMRRRSEKADK